jgi:hypothetical protein
LRLADLLAALGELVAFEDGNLVSGLLDDRFITMDPSANGLDLGHQLRGQRAQFFGGVWSRSGKAVMVWILPKQPECFS